MTSGEGPRRVGDLEVVESPLRLRRADARPANGSKKIILGAVLAFACSPLLARAGDAIGLAMLLSSSVFLQFLLPLLVDPRRRRGTVLEANELRLVQEPRAMIDVDGRLFPVEDVRDVVLTESRVRQRFGKTLVFLDVWLLLAGAAVDVFYTEDRAEASTIARLLRDALGLEGPAPVVEAPGRFKGLLAVMFGILLIGAAGVLGVLEGIFVAMVMAAAAIPVPALLHIASRRRRDRATLRHFGVER